MASRPSQDRYQNAQRGLRRTEGTKLPPGLLRRHVTTRGKSGRGAVVRAVVIAFAVMIFLVPAVALGAGAVYYQNTAQSLIPRLNKLNTYRAFQSSQVFDRNGTLLYEFVNQGRREPVPLNKISPLLINATISIENKTFYEDPGVDFVGILKAGYRAVSGNGASGASTITQQLVKLVILENDERSASRVYERKMTEVILAQELTKQKSKDEILELYLNEIPYGNLAYGIQAASKGYFGKDASDLNLNEASLLAGLPQSPTVYNPLQFADTNLVLDGVQLKPGTWLDPEAALPYGTKPPRARQIDVLRQMVLNGAVTHVTEEQARRAVAQPLQFTRQEVPLKAPHFVFYIKQLIDNDPALQRLLTSEGGLRITTTLDLRVQALAQEEARKRIDELEVDKRNIHNAAVVVLQPSTGQVLAMVGSVDYNKSVKTTTPGEEGNVVDGNVNVTTRQRQPGSALKPFTYLSALEAGKLNPGSVLWDVETRFPIKVGATEDNINNKAYWYGPKNFDQRWHGPIRMREALANSLNMPAVKALKVAGVGSTLDLLHRVGIGPTSLAQPPEYYGLALTLGGGEVTPLELTTAYNTLANGGMYVPTTPILSITDRDGKPLQLSSIGKPKQVVDEKYVALIRDYMGDNEARTPMFGKNNPLLLSRPAHAKTGTTEDFRDAWALGFTPYVTVGVWTGNNNNEKTAEVESVTGGGVIYHRIMERLFADPQLDQLLRGTAVRIPLDFPSPETYGDVKHSVCSLGGAFGQRDSEWFTPDELTQSKTAGPTGELSDLGCDLYKTVSVVRDPAGGYCLPRAGINYGDRVIQFRAWNTPKSEDDAKIIDAQWDRPKDEPAAGTAPDRVCDSNMAAAGPYQNNTPVPRVDPNRQPGSVPRPTPNVFDFPTAPVQQVVPVQPIFQPTPEPFVPTLAPFRPLPRPTPVPAPPVFPPTAVPVARPTVPPAPPTQPPQPAGPRMPSLIGFGENQARAQLAALGVSNVVVDYQGKDRLGSIWDKFPPYAVVSSSPGAGALLSPGTTVVLGVRGP